ncbi:MAG TPA: GNAT family N-acetyltransferase [Lacisediminihabitans sp.]|uniref:GNAT family N-acetyltransferase n=1 Tax=Lacisediminihabitans sp. TaxID=2787631 RepID=UPI002EDA740D
MIVREVPWDDPEATALRAAQRAEIAERYGTPDSEPGIAPSAADMTVFVVAEDDEGSPIGCGGLRELDEAEAEVKRMFVRRESRGSGASTAILDRLESIARERGYSRLLLETGDRQPDAVRFYLRQGYTRIPNFGHYAGHEASLCFAKPLLDLDPAAETGCEGCE